MGAQPARVSEVFTLRVIRSWALSTMNGMPDAHMLAGEITDIMIGSGDPPPTGGTPGRAEYAHGRA